MDCDHGLLLYDLPCSALWALDEAAMCQKLNGAAGGNCAGIGRVSGIHTSSSGSAAAAGKDGRWLARCLDIPRQLL